MLDVVDCAVAAVLNATTEVATEASNAMRLIDFIEFPMNLMFHIIIRTGFGRAKTSLRRISSCFKNTH